MSEVKVPVGYKQTEVGVIPESWGVFTLEDIANFGGGTTPARDSYDKYYAYGTNPWVKTLDLNNGFLTSTDESVTDTALQEVSLKKHPAGSVLIAMYGGFNQIGRTGLLKMDASINQALVAVIPHKSKLTSEYLLYNLNYNVDYWKNVASSSRKDPNITSNDIKKYALPLPPKPEQIAIANALTDTDILIQSLEKLIAKKEAIKTGTMQQLLTGKTRLPEFATREDGSAKGFKQTELGKIPEDWEIKKVGMLTNCTSGGTPNTSNPLFWGGTNPWMSSGELHLKRVYDVQERITDEGLESSSAKYIPKNSVLIGLAGQGKTRGTVAISKIPLCTNQSIGAILPSKAFSSEYLYYNLDNRYEELRSLSTGDGGRGGLNLKILRDLIFLSPSIKEQTAIATILSDMDAEIQALQDRLEKTKAIKQGMMQQLLTGKVRLVSPDQANNTTPLVDSGTTV